MANLHYGLNNINAGPLKEFPEICIDRFIGKDLLSTAFFISHGHTDHLVGLETTECIRRLNDEGIRLYCQTLTPILVGSFERYLHGKQNIKNLIKSGKIVILENEKPTEIEIPSKPDNYVINVTLLPAGHCPGSVMFLFEKMPLRVLHTGDCRLNLNDIKRMHQLKEFKDEKQLVNKKIDHLYIDTTFCCTDALKFPDRLLVIHEMISIIEDWIGRSKRHRVFIQFPAKFSHEYVLLRLHSKLCMDIHIDPDKHEIYKQLPELSLCVTLNPNTQLHFCKECVSNDKYSLSIKMSSLWFLRDKNLSNSGSVMARRGKQLKVCYSMHPSLSEVGDIINYLQPTIVTPLVQPKNSNVYDIEKALRSVCTVGFIYSHYQDLSHHTINRSIKSAPYTIPNNGDGDDPSDEPSTKMQRLGRIESDWNCPLSQSPSKKNSQSSDYTSAEEETL